MAEPPNLSIVVPTRNEPGNVRLLWGRLAAALQGVSFEVCFVDDSDDETVERLEELRREHREGVRCLFRGGHRRSGGLSTAVVEGLRMARGRFACVMDADLQHPPELIPSMLAAAETGADLVVASRYMTGGSGEGLSGLVRRTVSYGARVVARLLFSEARQSSDPLSGFFLCRRELIDGIEFRPIGFKILLELLVCVPSLEVRDVPLSFADRASGESKATLRQGLLFLRHVWSLVAEVKGSARMLKFGLVGLSGVAIFIPLLGVLSGPLGLHPLAAFVPAFLASLAWNTAGNRLWTFADKRRREGGEGPTRYLERSLVSGLIMLGSYALLLAAHVPVLIAGLVAAAVAMIVNGLSNYPSVRPSGPVWASVATHEGIQASLARLASGVGADRVTILPPDAAGDSMGVPAEIFSRVVADAKPVVWTEAPSHRPQRRTNVEVTSTLLAPVVGSEVLAVIVCRRHARRGFDSSELEVALRAAEALSGAVASAASGAYPAADRLDPSTARAS